MYVLVQYNTIHWFFRSMREKLRECDFFDLSIYNGQSIYIYVHIYMYVCMYVC